MKCHCICNEIIGAGRTANLVSFASSLKPKPCASVPGKLDTAVLGSMPSVLWAHVELFGIEHIISSRAEVFNNNK